MTQHGTSVFIKQTNDSLGIAEVRILKMLQVVARDKKDQEKETAIFSIHPSMFFLRRLCLSRFMILEHSRESLRLEDEEHLWIKKMNRCLYLDIFEL